MKHKAHLCRNLFCSDCEWSECDCSCHLKQKKIMTKPSIIGGHVWYQVLANTTKGCVHMKECKRCGWWKRLDDNTYSNPKLGIKDWIKSDMEPFCSENET